MRRALVSLLVLSACSGGGNKSLELTLTMPNGTVQTKTFNDDTGFLFEGEGRATASFPDIASWDKTVPVGVSVLIAPLQPGRYGSSGKLHLGADTVGSVKSLTLSIVVDRVRWQNEGAYPFRMEGTLSGTSSENHKVEGRFSTTTHDCSDKVGANAGSFLCGTSFPGGEQVWSIDRWVTEGDCPDAIFKRYAGAPRFTLDARFASAGGKQLQCVTTYAGGPRLVCGASEEGFQADGCTWAITTYATPGGASGPTPRLAIFAGTLGDSCAPKLCTMYPAALTHVSGG